MYMVLRGAVLTGPAALEAGEALLYARQARAQALQAIRNTCMPLGPLLHPLLRLRAHAASPACLFARAL